MESLKLWGSAKREWYGVQLLASTLSGMSTSGSGMSGPTTSRPAGPLENGGDRKEDPSMRFRCSILRSISIVIAPSSLERDPMLEFHSHRKIHDTNWSEAQFHQCY